MMKKPENFAAFILTHGRPDRVLTYDSLIKAGYTGKIYIIIDNEDKKAAEYKEKFGEQVVVFDKKAIADKMDACDNFEGRKAIVYARNACFDIAKQLGIHYFMQLDDDYTVFNYKFNESLEYCEKRVKNLDAILYYYLEYYKSIPALSIAFAQGGDFMGGKNGTLAVAIKIKRKAMNTWICSTDRPFSFAGRMNEDTSAYCLHGSRGHLIFTASNIEIKQIQTQAAAGGMTEVYQDNGTYNKTFYTVMQCPSFVKVSEIGATHKRLHHKISWANACPVIINEDLQKL